VKKKFGGRPKGPANERRSVRVQVLVTPDEMKTIQDRAKREGKPLSTYCHDVLLGEQAEAETKPAGRDD
jgi:hypothetical protein